MHEKKGDLGRLVIPINIGGNHFPEVLCDFGASVNIMPKVLYEKIHGDPLLYTTMCLQMEDQTLCYPKGILEDVCVRVGQSYVPTDFVVIETGGDERAPIILGRPFLCTAKAIIYADNAKISFNIKGRKETFTFRKCTLKDPTHPHSPYNQENYDRAEIKKKNQRNRNRQPKVESLRMVIAVDKDHDHLLASPHLIKREDPGVPTIECTINRCSFQRQFVTLELKSTSWLR